MIKTGSVIGFVLGIAGALMVARRIERAWYGQL